jgi:hypothetical protein
MSGRSYEIKNGKKVLLPTPLQIERMKKADAVLPHQDPSGRTGPKRDIPHIAYLKRVWNSFDEKERKAILDKGEATPDYALLRQYELYLAEQKGIIKDDRNDPKFKYALEKMRERWRLEGIEHYLMFDSKGRFIGYNIGDEKSVVSIFAKGGLAGGHTMHNHPTERGKRPLGLSFSAKDLESIRDEGTKTFEVSTREGNYVIESKGKVKYTPQDVMDWDTELAEIKKSIFNGMKSKGYRDPLQTDTYWRIRMLEHHQHMQRFANKFGLSYTFTPSKAYKGIDKMENMDKPLPPILN